MKEKTKTISFFLSWRVGFVPKMDRGYPWKVLLSSPISDLKIYSPFPRRWDSKCSSKRKSKSSMVKVPFFFSNEPFEKNLWMTIEDFGLHSDDHFESHLLGDRLYVEISLKGIKEISFFLSWKIGFVEKTDKGCPRNLTLFSLISDLKIYLESPVFFQCVCVASSWLH